MNNTDKAVMQQALDALVNHSGNYKLNNAEAHNQVKVEAALRAAIAQPASQTQAEPIDMVLYCPKCHMQHIDAQEITDVAALMSEVTWWNPPHRSHLCHGCGHIWRPADVATNGVTAIKTKGKVDSPAPVVQPASQTVEPVLATPIKPAQPTRAVLENWEKWAGSTSLDEKNQDLCDALKDIRASIDAAETALEQVLTAVQVYLPPYGITKDEFINRVIACVDPWPLTATSTKPVAQEPLQDAKGSEPTLKVWYGKMPESCGRTNWTARLIGNGEDYTIDRSEYPGRVRYAADCVRHIIGELAEKPFIFDYNGDECTPCHICGGTGEKDGKPCPGLNYKDTIHTIAAIASQKGAV